MDDIRKDPFEEYIKQLEPGKKELGYAWYTAIGLQDVDGLKTSDYLKKTAQDNIDGKISIQQANKLIESYYKESFDHDEDRSMEADIVSARIAAILSESAFTFSVPQYVGIHKRLFEGIYSHAGKIRDYNISKKDSFRPPNIPMRRPRHTQPQQPKILPTNFFSSILPAQRTFANYASFSRTCTGSHTLKPHNAYANSAVQTA